MKSKRKREFEKRWLKMYHLLLKFESSHGHTRVLSRGPNAKLGKWVLQQRKRENTMPSSQKELLDAIGFSWHRDIQAIDHQLWETKFQQLKAFHHKHGHFRMPYNNDQFYTLRNWVTLQRTKEKTLPPERKRKLDSIGFHWSKNVQEESAQRWNSMYKQLMAFKQKYGHFLVPSSPKKYKQLTEWLWYHRSRWTTLDKSKREKLEAIGYEPFSAKQQKWQAMFLQLKHFKKKHGHCRVPSRFVDNRELGVWVATQRNHKKRGLMLEWRKEKLNELGFEWDFEEEREKRWLMKYNKLQRFYHHFEPSLLYKEDPKLFQWMRYQQNPKIPLSKKKIKLLKLLN